MINKLVTTEEEFNLNVINKKSYIEKMYSYHDFLFQYGEFISNRDIQKIEITDDVVVFTTRDLGVKLVSKKNDQRMAPIEILNFKSYEKNDFDMVCRLIRDGDTVFDIGGNIGYYSIALDKLKKDLIIHAFEPIPNTYEYLVTNKNINGANINVHNFGLSDENKHLIFYVYKEGSGNASAAIMDPSKNSDQIKCEVKKLDDFFEECTFNKLDFIKCDVEGAELFSFKGGINTIKKYQPIIFTEMLRKWSAKFKYHPNDIINLLKPLGYSCFYEEKGRLKLIELIDDDTLATNFFFLCLEKHNDIIKKLIKS